MSHVTLMKNANYAASGVFRPISVNVFYRTVTDVGATRCEDPRPRVITFQVADATWPQYISGQTD